MLFVTWQLSGVTYRCHLPGVTCPPGSRFSAMAHTNKHTTHGHHDLKTDLAQWADAVKTIYVAKP